jgi:hypothetical protein
VPLVLVTVSGRVQGYDEQPSTGTITFTPVNWHIDPDEDLIFAPEPVVVDLLDDGSFALGLVAPDGAENDDISYRVDLALRTKKATVTDSYEITMPVATEGSYLNLADRDIGTGLLTVSVAPTPTAPSDDSAEVWS